MTNRHVGIISTMMVVTLIIILVFSQFIPFMHVGDRGEYIQDKKVALEELFMELQEDRPGGPNLAWVLEYLGRNPFYDDLIRVRKPPIAAASGSRWGKPATRCSFRFTGPTRSTRK